MVCCIGSRNDMIDNRFQIQAREDAPLPVRILVDRDGHGRLLDDFAAEPLVFPPILHQAI